MAVQYCPIMKKPVSNDKSNMYSINSDQFRTDDWELFVESLEIISRYERKRQEERKLLNEKRRQQKLLTFDKARLTPEKSTAATPNHTFTLKAVNEIQADGPKSMLIPQMVTERRQSIEEIMDEPVTHLEAKKLHDAAADETYYSGQDSLDNSPHNSLVLHDVKLKSTSDSEESGVFPVGEPFEFHMKGLPVRPRSEVVINKSQNTSPRSQIISLAVKRHCALSKATSLQDFDDLTDDILIAVERCDRALSEVMNQNYDPAAESKNHRQGFALTAGSPEEHFLDKALSLLQL